MKVCVYGLWHLGSVTAACLASADHDVVGLDSDQKDVDSLNSGNAPISEPGLDELIGAGLSSGNLRFTTNAEDALSDAKVVWICFDTPVDEEDNADVDFVVEKISDLFSQVVDSTLILISSQLPAGSIGNLETRFREEYPDKQVSFAYSPENLRLGNALDSFLKAERVVAGIRSNENKKTIDELLSPIVSNIIWMSVESAEMTKHALNAFLATSVTFINEIAGICEELGADATEVEQGLKSDKRIGPRAYLKPGVAYAGGTLERDINYLNKLGEQKNRNTSLLCAVSTSNRQHKLWTREKISSLMGNDNSDISNKKVAVWGLAYKPGTDTLRRSRAVELCEWLDKSGVTVAAYDPLINKLPENLTSSISLCSSPLSAVEGVSALVVESECPEFLDIAVDTLVEKMAEPVVIDANQFLADNLEHDQRIKYFTVGREINA